MSAEPIGADQDLDQAVAEDTLAALRRQGLIRSWRTTGGSYEVVVGRGTVRIPAMDAAGVLRLAETLRRDKVTVSSGGRGVGHRIVRYHLSDGRFADRHDSRLGRYLDDYRYTVYLPGGHPSGCAIEHFAAWTLKEALALAGLVRVCGRCQLCGASRPLHVRGWRPDPAIPCPGCGVGAAAPVTVLCRRCQQPVIATTGPGRWPTRAAWQHVCSSNPYCDTTATTPCL